MRTNLLLAAALVAVLAACSGGVSKTPAPAAFPPSATVAPSPVEPTPSATTAPAPVFKQLPDTLFPADSTLVFGTCAYGHGHGGCLRVERAYRDASGQVVREKLFEPGDVGGDNITGIEADEKGILFLGLCVGAQCPLEGEAKQVLTRLLVSRDGGVTWRQEAELDGEWWVRGASNGSALAVNFASPGPSWRSLPGNAPASALPDGGAFHGLNVPSQFQPGLVLDNQHLIATVDYTRQATCTAGGTTSGADPALVDLAAGTYAFIHDPFYDANCSHGTQRVVAAFPPVAETGSPEGFREFAQTVDRQLATGMIDFVIARLRSGPYTCKQSDVPQALGGPACEYVGQQFNGFPIGHWHSEGGLYPVENAAALLRRLQDESVPDAADAYGESRARVYAIGAQDGAHSMVLTSLIKRPANFAGSGPLRVVEVLHWHYFSDHWEATSLLSAFVLGDEFLVPMPEIQQYIPGWERLPFRPFNAFARVTAPSDCLNVRDKASKSAPSLRCIADGALLRLRNEPDQTADGATWVPVETPDGKPGWASAEFLQR